ncbi:MAG: galactitol-1-phosphate 5-dehydrogenase [Bacteroidales bacterium]|nr:galactitol-1-phosphate 5-dehydrogenase [Bacteroidales bacterium]
MKALVLEAYNKLVYKDFPDPVVAEDEVLIKVEAVGICGSDVHGMDGSSGRRIPPIVMGHEAAGVITALGKDVVDWSIGDRVTFDSTIYQLDDWYTRRGLYNLSDNRMVLGVSPGEYRRHGAFAEYVNVPQHILYRIPEGVSFTQASMVEPVAVAAHAVELTPVEWNDTAVVVGAGMIGLFVIQVLRARGCGNIIAIDLEDDKLTLARELGADVGLNPKRDDIRKEVEALTEGRGADVAFEVVGISDTVRSAIGSVRKGATVTLVGNLAPVAEIPLQSVVTKQIRLQGSCAICGEYPAVLDMIAREEVNVDAILSAEVPLSDGAEWFQRLYKREPGLIKVVLKP